MTDAKPVAELRREAHDRCGYCDGTLKEEECSPQHDAIDALADRAEAAEKQAFGDHTLAQEWQGRAEAAEQHVKILREARDEALARIANEVAARQRAQEHGIGDRARIEELERDLIATRSREELWHQAAIEARERIEAAERERDILRAFKRSVDEALNSGDGVYRP